VTQCNVTEDLHLQQGHCENIKSLYVVTAVLVKINCRKLWLLCVTFHVSGIIMSIHFITESTAYFHAHSVTKVASYINL